MISWKCLWTYKTEVGGPLMSEHFISFSCSDHWFVPSLIVTVTARPVISKHYNKKLVVVFSNSYVYMHKTILWNNTNLWTSRDFSSLQVSSKFNIYSCLVLFWVMMQISEWGCFFCTIELIYWIYGCQVFHSGLAKTQILSS